MEVICLEDKAFYEIIERVVLRLQDQHGVKDDKWISPEAAMQRLNITSKTTLQKLRDDGKIRYSQHGKKMILYDNESINSYLNVYSGEADHVIPWQTDQVIESRPGATNAVEAFVKIVI